MRNDDCMTRKMIVAQTDDTLYDTANKMKKCDIGFLPVAEGRKVVGVITDRDLVIRALANNAGGDETIADYITKQIVEVDVDDTVKDALEIMGKERVKRVLVTSQKRVVGILSLSDIITKDIDSDVVVRNLQKLWKIKTNYEDSETEIDDFYL